MTQQEAIDWLGSRKRMPGQRGVSVMRRLCAALGDPQTTLQFVHVAGTNGKGSTAAFIAAILHEAGYKTGLNSSPFVVKFGERMQINGENIGARALGSAVLAVKKAAKKLDAEGDYATEFECTTAAALVWFAKEACDFVVLEAGIGGLHDATNIIERTKVACITKVALDHTAVLGNTPAEIAKNKCGIFKKGCVVVSAPSQDAEVCSVIEAECAKLQVPLRVPEAEDVRVLWQTLKENHMDYGGYEVSLRMPGVHQAENAAVAIEAALALCDLGYTITDEAILAGLAKTKLPARIELVCTDPLTVIDGAHNPNGIATLAKTLREAKQPLMTGIIGMMRDKDVSALAALTPQFDCVYTVPACADARSFTPDELAAHCAAYFKQVEATSDLAAALKRAKQRGRGICICGSLYLAGEAEKFY